MRVSVIIPTRNRAHQLGTAIESVLGLQRGSDDIEIIVIDDGSTDDTPQVAQSYPVVYLRGQGQGVSTARNLGIRAATADLLAFLDDDDIFTHDNLTPQIAYLDEHPACAAVFGRMILGDIDLNPVSGPYPEQPLEPGQMFDTILAYIPTFDATVMRTSVARALGGFDPQLRGAEDWDFFLRIAKRHPMGYVHHAAAIARTNAPPAQNPEGVLWRRFRDCMTVWHRHTAPLGLARRIRLARTGLRHRGWYIPYFMGIATRYAQQGQLGPALRAWGYALAASPLHALPATLRALPSLARRSQ